MRLFAGPRQCGKTTKLILWAGEDPKNRIVVFADDQRRQDAQIKARSIGISLLATSIRNHLNNKYRYSGDGKQEFGFDDGCLEQALGVVPDALVVTTFDEPVDLAALVELEKDLRP